jgi:hypothetical protein
MMGNGTMYNLDQQVRDNQVIVKSESDFPDPEESSHWIQTQLIN